MQLVEYLERKKFNSLKVVLFFAGLTVVVTAVVIVIWEKVFMLPFYSLAAAYHPDDGSSLYFFQQRIEHFFISTTVDVLIVTLLLRIVSRQQRRLVASEKRYRALFEHAGDGIGVVAADDHTLVEVNNKFCDILGCQPKSLVGQDVRVLLSADDDGARPDMLPSLLDGDAPDEVELTIRAQGGAPVSAAVSASKLTADGERLVILMIHDLSERRRLEAAEREGAERLRRMQDRLAHQEKIAALGRAAAQVAHEVKNPLAGMLLYAMHLRGKAAGKLSEGEMALIGKIIDTINHLTDTVEQVLDFARPIRLAPRPADLNRVVSDVLQLLEPQIAAGRIELRPELDEGGCRAVLDEASVRSALMNLVLNAVQAMPGGGTLGVRTREAGASALVEIADTGGGMNAEQAENIFEPFHTTKSQGLGLGLPYARKVIEEHHGTISVESRPALGTTIRVELPREAGAS